ncbi:hypothetical protein [Spirillospora sp. CA-294931]|uniref:hypothetical protein n=1 Tax=Spirillospora sp. CA-294931 TaxID=3240042 RepID=UPI003D8B63E7
MDRSSAGEQEARRLSLFGQFAELSAQNKIAALVALSSFLGILVAAAAVIPPFLALDKDSSDPPPLGKLAPSLSPSVGGFPALPCKELKKVIECTVTNMPSGAYSAPSPFPGIGQVPNCHGQYDDFLSWVKKSNAVPAGGSGFTVNLRPRKGSVINVRNVVVHSTRMPIEDRVTLACAGGADQQVTADIDLDLPKPVVRYRCSDSTADCKRSIGNLTYPERLTLDVTGTATRSLVKWQAWLELIVDGRRFLLDLGSSTVSGISCLLYESDPNTRMWIRKRSGHSKCAQ